MGFTCGIVGLPNVGKSTIFNALTSQKVAASNYPFCTIEPNVGIVPLQDERLIQIKNIIGSAKATPTTLEFIDIAGLVKGASQGEGLGNQFLSHIQAVDAIAHVVRCFEGSNVTHVSTEFNPIDDVEVVIIELILKDLDIIERRLDKVKKLLKSNDKTVQIEHDLLLRIKDGLDKKIQAKHQQLDHESLERIRTLNLLTLKPTMFIANVDEQHQNASPLFLKLQQYVSQWNEPCVPFSAKAQAEIAQLDETSRSEFLAELNLDEFGLAKIVRAGYELLKLITFFTANENDAHAWTIPQGTTAKRAAGKIHTDFEQGFIKAEVIKYSDLISTGSEVKLREQGLIAVEGKEYIVQDGNILFFHHHI
jgi:ribosome-binding ATPase